MLKKGLKKIISLTLVTMSVIAVNPVGANANDNNSIIKNQVNSTIEKKGNTSGNLVNGAKTAQYGEWNYYIKNSNNKYSICGVKNDGSSEHEILASKDNYVFLNVVDGWIYYIKNYIDNNGKYTQQNAICKVKVDGNQETIILTNNIGSGYYGLNVVDDWIYYETYSKDGRKICKMKTNGNQQTEIISNGYNTIVAASDGWIYYKKSYVVNENEGVKQALCKIRIDGTNETQLIARDAYSIQVVNDWIYYVKANNKVSDGQFNYGIFKMKTDGSQESEILNINNYSSTINVSNDWIYYVSSESKIYKVKVDGTGKTELTDKFVWNGELQLVGDWIYYSETINTAMNTRDAALNRIRIDGSEKTVVKGDETKTEKLVNEKINYAYKDSKDGSVTIDSKEKYMKNSSTNKNTRSENIKVDSGEKDESSTIKQSNTNTATVQQKQEEKLELSNKEFYDDICKEMFRLVNEHREKNGIQPLKWSDELMNSSKVKSQHMIDNNYFSHEWNGMNCQELNEYLSGVNNVGENIYMYPAINISDKSAKGIAKSLFDGWKKSPGHNQNMLYTDYTKFGFGIAYTPNKNGFAYLYATQQFQF